MFGLTSKKQYDKLKKMYIELMQGTVKKMESGYLYMIGLPGADQETLRSVAKTFEMAMKAQKLKRTIVLCVGTDLTVQVLGDNPKPEGLPEIPVPKPRRKKQ